MCRRSVGRHPNWACAMMAGVHGDRPDRLIVGSHDVVVRATIETAPIQVEHYERLIQNSAAGALVAFVGTVRDHDQGQRVQALEYSAHPNAAAVLDRATHEVARMHRGVRGIAAAQRVGRLDIGEVALCVVVAAEHRHAAFTACSVLVETIKRDLPVWKLQVFSGGAHHWVGVP
ncbi:molybdenum cofactor biosynthesis protein MoaE [Mycobacterium attenuatum]|uniref:molybdenum cofactor biosynthesis protein MoaE n=1 Tax=Mycobacterium attenuatum TaxID=2341086 RepID=UPI000F267893|nr:Molybdopterin synthase catalytic subunit 2 [Mycobacterium attenuatum]VBA57271.1 Molybdopterin synthase catalytic subunit 2 [Mycobacterium attenuatum]